MVNKKRFRRKKTIEEIFETDHYRSIFFLTYYFGGEKGLMIRDYRYMLIKDGDGIKSTDMKNRWITLWKGREFLKNSFSQVIKPNSISSVTNLSNFLHKLVFDYEILEKYDEDQVVYYKIRKDCQNIPVKLQMIEIIKKCPNDYFTYLAYDFMKSLADNEVTVDENDYRKIKSFKRKYPPF
jgi:hypothetical protein